MRFTAFVETTPLGSKPANGKTLNGRRAPSVRYRREACSAETAASAESAIMERHRGRPAAALYEIGTAPHPAGTKRIKLNALLGFWETLLTAAKMNLVLLRGLKIAAKTSVSPEARLAANAARDMVQTGYSFASALERLPNLGDRTLFALIRSAESSSCLDVGLEQIVRIMKARRDMRSAIRGALFYPVIVLSMALILCTFLLWKVVPVFGEIYKELSATLPLPTRILIGASDWVLAHPVVLVLIIIALVLIPALGGKLITRPILIFGKPLIQRAVLRIPLARGLLMLAWESLFARTLHSLLVSQMLPPVALLLCRQLNWSLDYAAAIARVRARVASGDFTFAAALGAEPKFFSAFLVEAVEVGEETGYLTKVIGEYADVAQQKLKEASDALKTTLEPALLVIVAGLVGTIVAAIFLPLPMLIDSIK